MTETSVRTRQHGSRPLYAAGSRSGPERYLNRDLSWVDFDHRVLELAADRTVPLLERVKLCGIVSSNLDEFFAVRIGRLYEAQRANPRRRGDDGRTPGGTLRELRERVLALQAAQDALWLSDLQPSLGEAGIHIVAVSDASTDALRVLQRRFARELEPLLTPIAVGPRAAFPHLASHAVSVAAMVRDVESGSRSFVHVNVPSGTPRFLKAGAHAWVAAEDLVVHHLESLLPGTVIETSTPFRITRDADLELPDESDDLLEAVELELERRRQGEVVRLELAAGTSRELVALLTDELELTPDQVYESSAPLGLAAARELAELDRRELARKAWRPVTPRPFSNREPSALLDRIRRRDVLVHHPYQSFGRTVQAFLSAARDSDVTALKATVYRTEHPYPTLASLAETAEEGKQAVCLVELRARFDERRNIGWSRSLRLSGVDVVHGPPETKVHAKLTLLVREEPDGPRRYAHIGTGNYHASNALIYEDVSLFTADEDIAADVALVFNSLTGLTRPAGFRKLLVAPWFLRAGLLREIDDVIGAAEIGQPSRIRIKVNALGDQEIIDALYRASQAGCDVQLIVRGICTLRPGVPGLSDRITVHSVLGRFLEHSRIFAFQAGDRLNVWLGSADLLPRNLDRRVETLAPVEDSRARAELSEILDTLLADTESSWRLRSDDRWQRVVGANGARPFSAQGAFMAAAARRARKHR